MNFILNFILFLNFRVSLIQEEMKEALGLLENENYRSVKIKNNYSCWYEYL